MYWKPWINSLPQRTSNFLRSQVSSERELRSYYQVKMISFVIPEKRYNRCWTEEDIVPTPDSYVNLQFNKPEVSFVATSNITFDGIRFEKSANIPTSTLINMTSNASLILQVDIFLFFIIKLKSRLRILKSTVTPLMELRP